MTRDSIKRPEHPAEPVQRRSTDALWFTVLFASIATGLGMTMFGPIGDAPSATPAVGGNPTTLPLMPLESTSSPAATQPTASPMTGPTP